MTTNINQLILEDDELIDDLITKPNDQLTTILSRATDNVIINIRDNSISTMNAYLKQKQYYEELKTKFKIEKRKYKLLEKRIKDPYVVHIDNIIGNIDITKICCNYMLEKYCTSCSKIYYGSRCICRITVLKPSRYRIFGKLEYSYNAIFGHCHQIVNDNDITLLKYWKCYKTFLGRYLITFPCRVPMLLEDNEILYRIHHNGRHYLDYDP